VAAAELGA